MNANLEMLKKEKEEMLKRKWAELEAAIPEEFRADIIRELKTLYSLYDDKAVEWMAGLYDPGVGGFYCAESARDTEAFLPDIEDTFYAFSLVGSLGMAERFDGKWEKALPRDILEKAAEWIVSLQREDGYFYHPQWADYKIETRIIRDRGSANTVLNKIGVKPKYEFVAPSAKKDDGKKASPLPQYESLEAFKAHLAEFERELVDMPRDKKNFRFYWLGNHFQGVTGLLTPEMRDLLKEFFDKYQNPETGMWTDELCYNSTNGIHKIGCVYNWTGKQLNHIDKIVDSTLEILKWGVEDHPADCTCNIYNVWSCLPYIYQNIRSCGEGTPEEREAKCEAIKRRVFSGVADAIHKTYEQMIDYLLPDGSFSYCRHSSVWSMQGCHSAVKDTKEGDLGGFAIAVYDMPHYILAALELEKYQIPVFAEYDRVRFIDALYKRVPVVKKNPRPDYL